MIDLSVGHDAEGEWFNESYELYIFVRESAGRSHEQKWRVGCSSESRNTEVVGEVAWLARLSLEAD